MIGESDRWISEIKKLTSVKKVGSHEFILVFVGTNIFLNIK